MDRPGFSVVLADADLLGYVRDVQFREGGLIGWAGVGLG